MAAFATVAGDAEEHTSTAQLFVHDRYACARAFHLLHSQKFCLAQLLLCQRVIDIITLAEGC